jgi:hypothetical protein
VYNVDSDCDKWMEILSTSVNNKYITTVASNDFVYGFDEYHAKVRVQPFPVYSS